MPSTVRPIFLAEGEKVIILETLNERVVLFLKLNLLGQL